MYELICLCQKNTQLIIMTFKWLIFRSFPHMHTHKCHAWQRMSALTPTRLPLRTHSYTHECQWHGSWLATAAHWVHTTLHMIQLSSLTGPTALNSRRVEKGLTRSYSELKNVRIFNIYIKHFFVSSLLSSFNSLFVDRVCCRFVWERCDHFDCVASSAINIINHFRGVF